MIEELLQERLAKLPEQTTAFRVLDGVGDGVPDVFVDRLGDKWLVSTRDRTIPSYVLQELSGRGEDVYHKRLDRDLKEAPVLLYGEGKEVRFIVQEQGISFLLDVSAGYSQGLFLDQRDNRKKVREMSGRGDKVLNTFAYTGAFSLYAAVSGAMTTTLDLAQPCLDWAKENMNLNGISPEEHYFCKGDTLHWLDRFARQDRKFNGIIMDPPTFSRDKKGKIWRVEEDYGHLVALAYNCLLPGGWMLCTTNCRKMNQREFVAQIREALPRGVKLEAGGMPFDFTGEQYLKTVWVYT